MTKLFIAIREEDVAMVGLMLNDSVKRCISHRMTHAVATLDHSFDLILCGLHFDDGRMFDLLRHAKSDPSTRDIPFICIRGAGRALTPAIYRSITIAAEKLGAAAFVDIPHLIACHGAEHATAILGEGLKKLVGESFLSGLAWQGAGTPDIN